MLKNGNMILAGFVIFALFVITMALLIPNSSTMSQKTSTASNDEDEGSVSNSTDFSFPTNQTNSDKTDQTNEQIGVTPVPKVATNSIVKNDLLYKKGTSINGRDDYLFFQTENYQIVYFGQTDDFLISIFSSDFDKYRKEAEEKLLDSLQIKTSDACKLKISTVTPLRNNSTKAGKSYPLSFCN